MPTITVNKSFRSSNTNTEMAVKVKAVGVGDAIVHILTYTLYSPFRTFASESCLVSLISLLNSELDPEMHECLPEIPNAVRGPVPRSAGEARPGALYQSLRAPKIL